MNRRVRVGILIALLGVGLVLAGFVVLSNFIQQSLAPLPPPTAVPPITQDVVVASRDIALGTLLQASDVQIAAVPVELVPRNRLTDTEQAVGRIVKAPLTQGEMILDAKLADPTNINRDLAFVIGDDKVLFAFPVTDLMTQLAIFERGDIVDIFVTVNQEVKLSEDERSGSLTSTTTTTGETGEDFVQTQITFNAFQQLEITAVVADVQYAEDQQAAVVVAADGSQVAPQATPQPTSITVRALLLALDPQDVLVLKHLKDLGATFDLVLRSPTSTEFFDLTPVTSDYLVDKYELETRR